MQLKKADLLAAIGAALRKNGAPEAEILKLIKRLENFNAPDHPIFLIIGAPAVGKGTTTAAYSDIYHGTALPIHVFSTLLREYSEGTNEFSKDVKQAMEGGILVPDYIVLHVLLDHIENAPDTEILDGVPRTVLQAMVLEAAGVNIKVIWLDANLDELRSRNAGRGRADADKFEKRYDDWIEFGKPAVEELIHNGADWTLIHTDQASAEHNAKLINAFIMLHT
jgi:adenylate kinase